MAFRFPFIAGASFGIRGANVPALLRALVACGWFGIQTWIGGEAIYKIAAIFDPSLAQLAEHFPVHQPRSARLLHAVLGDQYVRDL